MCSEMRMIVGGKDRGPLLSSRKYMQRISLNQSVHSVCSMLSILPLHYVRVSHLCSVHGDTWVLQLSPDPSERYSGMKCKLTI